MFKKQYLNIKKEEETINLYLSSIQDLILSKMKISGKFNNIDINEMEKIYENSKLEYRSDSTHILVSLQEEGNILLIKVEINPLKEQEIDGEVCFYMCPQMEDCSIFLPTYWAYCGKTKDFASYDSFYPGFTCGDGYKERLRTPAISVWNKDAGITVGMLDPKPVHIKIMKDDEDIKLIIPFDKPLFGPDRCMDKPHLQQGEKLEYSFYLYPHLGNWEEGMKEWMKYVKEEVIEDHFQLPSWIENQNLYLAKWTSRVTKHEIDRMSELGVKFFEVFPWTEPDQDMIDYVHAKGMKILMEYQLLSYYEVNKCDLKSEVGREKDFVGSFCSKIAEVHPDWCVQLDDGSFFQPGDGYIYMDPNVRAFREAKVNEAVNKIKQGYDGIRYDNGIIMRCSSRLHTHTMTYAEATMLMIKEIMQAVRQVNSEAIIFINNGGPDLLSVADMQMTEGGLSLGEDNHLYEQGLIKTGKSNFKRTHNRFLAVKCIGEFMDKKMCIWDYPGDENEEKIYRSVIFNIMHNSISGFGGANKFREKEYAIASSVYKLIQNPITDIIQKDNIAYRIYEPGIILVLENENRNFDGKIELEDYTCNSIAWDNRTKVKSVKTGLCIGEDDCKKEIPVHLDPESFEILIFTNS